MPEGEVERLSETTFVVTVPVRFSVAVDRDGNVVSVEEAGTGRRWVRNGHNEFGNAYPEEPTGLLAKASRLARLYVTRFRQELVGEGPAAPGGSGSGRGST